MSSGETSITTIFLLSSGIPAYAGRGTRHRQHLPSACGAAPPHTLALLRTIGANKSQLHVSVLFEAGVLGLGSPPHWEWAWASDLMAALCQSGLMKATGMTYMRLVLSGPVFTVPMAFGIIMTVIASLKGSARSIRRRHPRWKRCDPSN